jgi:alginate O-acetyltransferase complex protein AlgI
LTRLAGSTWQPLPLGIALPLGVSFFTFQGVAYLVDVASGEPPFASLRTFMLYKAFWPQLIAGPIIRPGEIREQLESNTTASIDDIAQGVKRLIQGAFKKAVLADTLAQHVDLAFLAQGTPHVLDTLAGVVGFGLQIYFDFSGYSDIAIGSARLFGYRFPENFDYPYLATSPQEFWNGWHMTLSRWIRDYVFTPLSFATRRHPQWRGLWLIVAMSLCGLWHGAQWTFVCWGLWHGLFLAAQQTLLKPLFARRTGLAASLGWMITMCVVFAGWLLFRASSLANVAEHVRALLTLHGGLRPALIRENGVLSIGIIAVLSLVWMWFARRSELAVARHSSGMTRGWLRPVLYACLLVLVVALDQEAKTFVYFQF